ncbi:very-long-chain (3R)-3-hydroxyacyl-CoA dehydratase 4 isoform 3-T4 [Anomaloglossus baeobatrachus]
MQVCQLLSVLELLHILMHLEQQSFLPKFSQVTERLIILFLVITSQEEVQSKCIVCVLFFLWNLWDVIRYPYLLLSAVGIDYPALTWLYHTIWIAVHPLSLIAEVYTVYESLPYFEALGTFCYTVSLPFVVSIHFPYILKVYLVLLPAVLDLAENCGLDPIFLVFLLITDKENSFVCQIDLRHDST